MDIINVNRIKQEKTNTSQQDIFHNWNLAEIKIQKEDGLHINLDSVEDQHETFQVKEEYVLQWDDLPGDAQIKEENNFSETRTFPIQCKTEVETYGSHKGIQTLENIQLDINQETVDDQNGKSQLTEKRFLQYDDSPGNVQINGENDDTKISTFTAADQNETFQIGKESISQWDESSSILQFDNSTGYFQIKEENNYSEACEDVVAYKTELETAASNKRKLSRWNNKLNKQDRTTSATACDISDNSDDDMAHIETEMTDKSCKCDICGKTCYPSQLKIHKQSHTAKKRYQCNICGKPFTQPSILKYHILTHTGEKPHKCDICGKAFTTSSNLKSHILIHTGDNPNKCNICGKAFTRSSDLKKHKLIHTGEKPHKCDICGKALSHSGNLKVHILTHTGEKPHICDICGKAFARSSDLKNHILTHTGKKPHKCNICGKAFTWSNALKRHILTHTGEKAHKCDICENHSVSHGI